MNLFFFDGKSFFWARISALILFVLMSLSGAAVAAMDFFSLSGNAVVMYDAPSKQATKLYVASLHLPVEAVVDVDGWVKVRDHSGGLAWVEKSVLSSKRYVIVTVELADVYQSAALNANVVYQLEKNVVIELLGITEAGWAKVRHRDGQTGYIKVNQVWGV